MFESTGYISRMLIALFVVSVTPWVVAKLYQYYMSMRASKKFSGSNFNRMIREEMWRMVRKGVALWCDAVQCIVARCKVMSGSAMSGKLVYCGVW